MPREAEDDALMLAVLMQWQREWPDAAIAIAAADRDGCRDTVLEVGLRLSHQSGATLIAIGGAWIGAAIREIEMQPQPDEASLQRLREALARLSGDRGSASR